MKLAKVLRSPPRAYLAALVAVQVALLVMGSRSNYAVVDEVAHIPAGVSHWQTGDYTLYRVNPPLGRMLATLPLIFAHPKTDYTNLDTRPLQRSDFAVGNDFAAANGSRYFDLVCLARLTGIGWTILGTLIIYGWAGELYGGVGACLAATLWALDPTVMAMGPPVLPDMPSTVAGLLATYVFVRYLRLGTWRLACMAGLLLGVTQLCKFTMLILYVVWTILWTIHHSKHLFGKGHAADRGPLFRRQLVQGLAIVALSVLTINLGYGFRESLTPLRDFNFTSNLLRGSLSADPESTESHETLGNPFRMSWLGLVPVPLPAEYVRGIDDQRRYFESATPSYLAGRWRNRGWAYFYVYALAVKEPLGTIALVVWALALTLSRHRVSARLVDECDLLVTSAVILAFVSSQIGFTHHLRYVLPCFPFAAIALGKLGAFLRPGNRMAGTLVIVLTGWSAASSLALFPHSISYFNEVAGGPLRGHHHLLYSNSDWGQDMLILKKWLDDHPEVRPLWLVCMSCVDPRVAGIEYSVPPVGPDGNFPDSPKALTRVGPLPGYYVVSVSYLQGRTGSIPDGKGEEIILHRHDSFDYLRRFQPIARAGYSIYIYRITVEQANKARREMGLPPVSGRAS